MLNIVNLNKNVYVVEIDEIKASAEYDSKLEEAINTVFEEDEESDGYGEDD